jgi:ABC-type nickel/cobalt efflux system permease component RcnA
VLHIEETAENTILCYNILSYIFTQTLVCVYFLRYTHTRLMYTYDLIALLDYNDNRRFIRKKNNSRVRVRTHTHTHTYTHTHTHTHTYTNTHTFTYTCLYTHSNGLLIPAYLILYKI